MTRREEPVGRLVVGEPILGRHRILEQPDRIRAPPLGGGDARRHERPRDVEDGVERVESGGGIGGGRRRAGPGSARRAPPPPPPPPGRRRPPPARKVSPPEAPALP